MHVSEAGIVGHRPYPEYGPYPIYGRPGNLPCFVEARTDPTAFLLAVARSDCFPAPAGYSPVHPRGAGGSLLRSAQEPDGHKPESARASTLRT